MKFAKVFLVLGAALALSGCVYSHGERAGIVTKFSEKGLICKTFEGELLMGGMKTVTDGNDASSLTSNIFEFTVSDPSLVAEIQTALQEGNRVSLVYDQYLMHNPCNGSTGYFIVDVK